MTKTGIYKTDRRKKNWKTQIIGLCIDFLIPEKKCRNIINEVETKYANSSDELKYDKAHKMMMEVI